MISRILAVSLSLLIAEQVFGQAVSLPDVASVQNEGARIVYDEVYGFNDLTAEDLLNRLPGIQDLRRDAQSQTSAAASARRGFGSTGDQILIDGRRQSGKSNTIASALRRSHPHMTMLSRILDTPMKRRE